MPPRKRALSDNDKERRKEQILNAAWLLYKNSKGNLPTVNQIARQAGIAKGTVYIYFESKEDIYLDVHARQIQLWVEAIVRKLNALAINCSGSDIASAFLDYLHENPLILNLASVSYSLLDRKGMEQQLFETKVHMAVMAGNVGRAVSGKWPQMPLQDSERLALRVYSVVVGLWQTLSHAGRVNHKISKMGISLYDTDMLDFLKETVELLIHGALRKSSEPLSQG